MHGVEWVTLDGRDLLVFSSNGYPPTEPEGEWGHDIFFSWLDGASAAGSIHAEALAVAPLAQEPVSAAVNSNGYLLVSSEDAQYDPGGLDQTFGIYDSDLEPVVPYGDRLMPPQGGHSGHAAASGADFLVSFCDGWVDGGGVDGLGTGDDVYARIVHQDGSMGELVETQVGEDSRDWWPLVAGSDTEWLQVWQRYGTSAPYGGNVWGAITSKSSDIVTTFEIADSSRYYYYDVTYAASLERYVVTGSREDGGFVALVDKSGDVVASRGGLPPTVREARTVVEPRSAAQVRAAYPVDPTGVAVVGLTDDDITLLGVVESRSEWGSTGTAGRFVSDSEVVFATTGRQGVDLVAVDIGRG